MLSGVQLLPATVLLFTAPFILLQISKNHDIHCSCSFAMVLLSSYITIFVAHFSQPHRTHLIAAGESYQISILLNVYLLTLCAMEILFSLPSVFFLVTLN